MALNSLGLGFVVTAKDAASAVMHKAAESVAGLEHRVDAASTSFEHLAGRTARMGATKPAANPMGVNFDELGGKLTMTGAKLTALGLAGAGGLGYAANAAMEFGNSVAEVASISDRAAFPIELIKQIGYDMAGMYGGDLNRQVKALYQAISSGASTAADATALLHSANLLAVGGLADSFQAVDALTNVANAFGMSLAQTSDIADAMFVAVKVGKTDISQLAGTIGDIAPMANLAGVSMEDMFSAIAAASNQLGSGTAAITGIRQAISGILKPTSEAAEEAKRLGIEFNRAHLSAVGFPAFLKEITGASGYTVDSMSLLFGSVEAVGAIAALTARDGQALTDATKAMSERAGAATAAFRTMADAASFVKTQIGANLQIALTRVGEIILPMLEKLARTFNEVLLVFNRAPAIVQQTLVAVTALGSAFALISGGALLYAGAIAGLVALGEIVVAVFAGAAVMVGGFAAGLATLGLVTAGFRSAIERDVGGVGSVFTNSFGKARLAFNALVQLFTDGGFSGAVLTELHKAGNEGVERFATQVFLVFNRIKNFVYSIAEGFSTAISTMGPTFQELGAALTRLGAVFGFMQDSPTKAASAFAHFGAIGRVVGTGLAGVFELLTKVITAVVNVAGGFMRGFSLMGPVLSRLGDAALNVIASFSAFGPALGGLGGNASSATSGFEMLGMAIGAVASVLGYFISLATNGFAIVLGVVASVVGALSSTFGALVDMVRGTFDFIAGLLTGNWPRMWEGAKVVVFNMVKGIVSILSGLLSTIGGVVDGIGRAFGQDLGIQKAIDGGARDLLRDAGHGLGVPAAGKVTPTAAAHTSGYAPTSGGGALPAVASAEATGAAAAAAEPRTLTTGSVQPPPPIDLTSHVIVQLDGEALGEAMTRRQYANTARTFGPIATHT